MNTFTDYLDKALSDYVNRALVGAHRAIRAAAVLAFDREHLEEFWEEIAVDLDEYPFFNDGNPATSVADFMPDQFVYAVWADGDGVLVYALSHKRDLADVNGPRQSDMEIPDYFMERSGFSSMQKCAYESVNHDGGKYSAEEVLVILGIEQSEQLAQILKED